MFGGKKAHAPHDFELNLTPVIDCFVTLICFLLLSATYVNLVGLEAKVPVVVPNSSAPAQDNTPKFKLELTAKKGAVELMATNAGPASGKRMIADVGGKRDFSTLHAELVKIKKERPKEFSLHFTAQVDMPYEELVRFMDTARNGGTSEMALLFPDFVMANLAGEGI